MVSKIKTDQKGKIRQLANFWSVWAMMVATLFGSSEIARRPAAVVNTTPAYAFVNPDSNLWNRNDNENETVHLTADFDVGVRVAPISGRK